MEAVRQWVWRLLLAVLVRFMATTAVPLGMGADTASVQLPSLRSDERWGQRVQIQGEGRARHERRPGVLLGEHFAGQHQQGQEGGAEGQSIDCDPQQADRDVATVCGLYEGLVPAGAPAASERRLQGGVRSGNSPGNAGGSQAGFTNYHQPRAGPSPCCSSSPGGSLARDDGAMATGKGALRGCERCATEGYGSLRVGQGEVSSSRKSCIFAHQCTTSGLWATPGFPAGSLGQLAVHAVDALTFEARASEDTYDYTDQDQATDLSRSKASEAGGCPTDAEAEAGGGHQGETREGQRASPSRRGRGTQASRRISCRASTRFGNSSTPQGGRDCRRRLHGGGRPTAPYGLGLRECDQAIVELDLHSEVLDRHHREVSALRMAELSTSESRFCTVDLFDIPLEAGQRVAIFVQCTYDEVGCAGRGTLLLLSASFQHQACRGAGPKAADYPPSIGCRSHCSQGELELRDIISSVVICSAVLRFYTDPIDAKAPTECLGFSIELSTCQCAIFGCYTSFELIARQCVCFCTSGPYSHACRLLQIAEPAVRVDFCCVRIGPTSRGRIEVALVILQLVISCLIGAVIVALLYGKHGYFRCVGTSQDLRSLLATGRSRCETLFLRMRQISMESGSQVMTRVAVILWVACCIRCPSSTDVQSEAQAIGLSFWGGLLLALCIELSRSAGLLQFYWGRLLMRPVCPFLRPMVYALGGIGQMGHPLLPQVDGQITKPSRSRRRDKRRCTPPLRPRPMVRLCSFLLGLINLPVPSWGHIPGSWWLPILGSSVCTSGYAMAAPESWVLDRLRDDLEPDELPAASARAHAPAVSSDASGTPLASADVRGLSWPPRFSANGHSRGALDGEGVVRIPLAPADATVVTVDNGWLGVIVLAPHCQTTEWAFRLSREDSTEEDLFAKVLGLGPALYDGFFDAVTPVVPSKHPGYAMVLVYNTVTLSIGDMGHVPVILDLSQVGGQYYATVLPARMPYDDLRSFVLPQVRADVGDFLFFIGLNQTACPPWADVRLQPGEVISVQTSLRPPISNRSLSQLFHPEAHWAPIALIPRNASTPAFCVAHARKRYVLHKHQAMEGQAVVDAVSSLLEAHPSQLTMHVHRVPTNLDVQGHACAAVISVVDLPRPDYACPVQRLRRDTFVLCDLRPLGFRPFAYHTHAMTVHIPTILALASLRIPDGYQLSVLGGEPQGWDICVEGSTTLIFQTRQVAPAVPSEEPPPPSDHDEDDDVGCDTDDSQDDDPFSGGRPARRSRVSYDSVLADVRMFTDGATSHHALGVAPCRTRCRNAISLIPEIVGFLRFVKSWRWFDLAVDSYSVWLESPAPVDLCSSWRGPLVWGPKGHKGPDQPRLHEVEHQGQHLPTALEGRLAQDYHCRDASHCPPPQFEIPRPEPAQQVQPVAEVIFAVFVIFAPEYQLETLTVMLTVPCSAEDACLQVESERESHLSFKFPRVVATNPQLTEDYATLLALPAWDTDHTIVIFDCRGYNGTAYSEVVTSIMHREDLLVMAGLGSGACVQVCVRGELLEWGELAHLVTGDVVSIMTWGIHRPLSGSLEERLQNPQGWLEQPELPEGRESALWVLDDALASLFPFRQEDRLHLRRDIAEHLDYDLRQLTLRAARPGIRDYANRGWQCQAVIVATREVDRSRSSAQTQRIVVLDLRPLLMGVDWFQHDGDYLHLPTFMRRFEDLCPEGYMVVVLGGQPEEREDGTHLHLDDGQTLTIEFVTRFRGGFDFDMVDSDWDASDSTSDGDDDGHSSGPDTEMASQGASPSQLDPPRSDAGNSGGHRSRSPSRGVDATSLRGRPIAYSKPKPRPHTSSGLGPLCPV